MYIGTSFIDLYTHLLENLLYDWRLNKQTKKCCHDTVHHSFPYFMTETMMSVGRVKQTLLGHKNLCALDKGTDGVQKAISWQPLVVS